MNEVRTSTQSLATAGQRFANSFDEWVRRFRREAEHLGTTRAKLLEPQVELRNLHGALGWNLSVGLYGQSQCGKSMLVSCFGENLGAKVSDDQHRSLLVADTIPLEQRLDPARRPRWYPDEASARRGGILFTEWFDPQNGAESTGIVCRFTARDMPGVKPGFLLFELMDLSEIISSLALGFASEFKRREDPDRQRKIVLEIQRLDKAPRERDPENLMGQVLHAWKFLVGTDEFREEPRFRMLDVGHEGFGWDELVCKFLESGTRPIRSDRDEPSDFDRLVELLWDQVPAITRVWKRLSRDLLRLGQARHVLARTEEVCTMRPRDTVRPSLLSVQWASRLFAADVTSTLVEPLDRPNGVTVLSHASLHCLARTLVLPTVVAGIAGSHDSRPAIDVIDYPGARDARGDLDPDDFEQAADFATLAFLRGKLNRLFIASVQYHDTSVLCLTIQGKDNLVAGRPMKATLRAWLRRERWYGLVPVDEDAYPTPDVDQPPLVVAITKSDSSWPQAPNSFVERMRLILSTYSDEAGFHWMQAWTPGNEPFRDIHWVHNGQFAKDGWQGDAAATIRRCLEQDVLVQHSRNLEDSLKSLTDRPARDVDNLFRRVAELARHDRRDGLLLRELVVRMQQLVSQVNAIYIGKGDRDRREREKALAIEHVAELEQALSKSAPVADFLSAIAISPEMVSRAFDRASQEAAEDDEGQLGTVGFEEFYKSLCSIFIARFDKELDRDTRWIRSLSIERGTKAKLSARFKQFTGAEWFLKDIRPAATEILDRSDAASMNVDALGSVLTAIWNRNMVWLGEVPPPPVVDPRKPPSLRSRVAASAEILAHWKRYLPHRYEQLADPRDQTTPHNVRLGEIRKELLAQVDIFLASPAASISRGPEWEQAVGDLERLRDSLLDSEGEKATP